jgi:hypothetical protein
MTPAVGSVGGDVHRHLQPARGQLCRRIAPSVYPRWVLTVALSSGYRSA